MAVQITHVDIAEAIANDRADKKTEKGKALIAAQQAREAQAWYEFLVKHSGTRALQNKTVFYDCEANRSILDSYLREHFLSTDLHNLETAFNESRAARQLVEWSEPYTRKADSAKGIPSQVIRPTFERPVVHLDYSRDEIIKMRPDALRRLLAKGGQPVRDEVTRILNQKR